MKILSSLFVLFLLLFAQSCTKEDTANNLLGTWKLVTVQEAGAAPESPDFDQQITLYEDGNASIQLNVNSCGLDYTLQDNTLNFSAPFCTEACCDEAIADTFLRLLREVETYERQGERLILEGAGQIVLER